jgi:hypothetical protein
MGGKRLLVAASVVAAVATGATAATVTVTDVARPRAGRLRIALRYEPPGRPALRLVRVCPSLPQPRLLVAATVRFGPGPGEADVELGDDFMRLDPRHPCPVGGLAVELVRRGRVLARADDPSIPPPTVIVAPAPPPPSALPSRLGFAGGKYLAPQTRMSQAGVTWSFTNWLKLQLSYERTAFAPTMSKDHDDGVVTGLKLTF